MRLSFFKLAAVAFLTAEVAVASTWFSKAAYNKWHETELERWLSDHDVPYPTSADRKDLELLVKNNWQASVVDPVSSYGDKAADSYASVKDWIFDSWTDSSLKAFLDHNNIPSPQPRTRDSLLTSVRQNYDAVAKKTNEHAAYPGNWLYSSWSESDLKEYLDTHGIPVPQPSTRDKLVASVRRNSYLASLKMSQAASSASASASSGMAGASASASSGVAGASASASSGLAEASKSAASVQASLGDALFDSWSDSKLKEFLDEHGVPVPQGSKKNELIALARKHRAKLTGNEASSVSASGASAYGAASSKAGNAYAKATDDASLKTQSAFDAAVDTWSDSRLKAFLDARGVPVPQAGNRDELLASVRLNAHKASSSGWSAWTFDTWTKENLQKYLESSGKKFKKNAKVSRDELVKQAQDQYASASKSGGTGYASATNYLTKQTDAAKDAIFDTWSDSDLKSYLDSYGVPNYQGSNPNELRAEAKKQATYFKYGTSSPPQTFFAKIQSGLSYLFSLVKGGTESGVAQGQKNAEYAASKAAASTASLKKEL